MESVGCSQPKMKAYSIEFKLAAVAEAEESGNRHAGLLLSVDERRIREWRQNKAKLEKLHAETSNCQTKQVRGRKSQNYTPKWDKMVTVPSASALSDALRSIAPLLSKTLYKGQCGRIAIFGGSAEYTGAPYYAAISALRAGADLSYVICPAEAASAIKSYSPELIVYPTLNSPSLLRETMDALGQKLHAAVVGPGFGRAENSFGVFKSVMEHLKCLNIPIIVDADGLYFVSKDVSIVKNYNYAVLTPNAVEFDRIFYSATMNENIGDRNNPENVRALCERLENLTIVKKGERDVISNGLNTILCETPCSARRCGGQGDLLSGSLGTFAYWAFKSVENKSSNKILQEYDPLMIASYGACSLTKRCNEIAFERFGRSTTTEDMINFIHVGVKEMFD